ncbi:MAG TPA: DNA polymerase/3'-5' exonuclease PolX [Actinobacteria bacterium]|nr:DNA polymerase/3'-5' exonuclease PolX [Actinomycetota bacterium]
MARRKPTNDEVVRVLRELIEYEKLEEGSAQSFRVRAYEKAVDAVRSLGRDVADLSLEELRAVDGIGDHIARRIRAYVETGRIDRLEELRAKYPPGLLELLKIPGLGPKTVLRLWNELGVATVDDLRRALDEHRVRELPRMSERMEAKLAKAIERLGLHAEEHRFPIGEALPLAEELVAELRGLDAVVEVAYAGSLRRFRDTIGDLDVVVASRDPATVMAAVRELPQVDELLLSGETKTSFVATAGMQVDVRVVEPEQYGAALLYFTGSKAHNIRLRQLAIERSWTLNEYALADADTGEVVASRTEEDIYEALGLSFVLPPLREDRGEIEAALEGTLPEVVTDADVIGDLHVHTTWSGDGRSSLAEILEAAHRRGLRYVAITEHGENLTINGLDRDRVLAEREEIEAFRERYPDMVILHGSELNIGRDGGLDYDDEFLAGFDWCVASVHSHFDLPQAEQTERIVTAMHHPAVNAVGHLTGRLIGTRPGIELDFAAIADAAAATGTALEINGHLSRLDVPADLLWTVRDRDDVLVVIDSDAHHVSDFENLRYGVRVAQRGWVARDRVVNTWPPRRFLAWARRKRR